MKTVLYIMIVIAAIMAVGTSFAAQVGGGLGVAIPVGPHGRGVVSLNVWANNAPNNGAGYYAPGGGYGYGSSLPSGYVPRGYSQPLSYAPAQVLLYNRAGIPARIKVGGVSYQMQPGEQRFIALPPGSYRYDTYVDGTHHQEGRLTVYAGFDPERGYSISVAPGSDSRGRPIPMYPPLWTGR